MCEPLSQYLESIFHKKGYIIHGGIPAKKRTEIVEKFNDENTYVPYIVLSFKAAGTGLNLTAANHVIHYDRWWKPAEEKQASDLAYRIGQTKEVFVHKLVSNGTIEEKIDKLYDELKIKISEIDVDLTMMGKNASKKNILVTNDSFNFLSKYNINVISIKEGDTKSINDAKKLINSGEIKYAYVLRGNTLSQEIETFIKNYNLEKIEIDSMYTITDEDKNNGNNYLSIMTENINKFKTELFR